MKKNRINGKKCTVMAVTAAVLLQSSLAGNASEAASDEEAQSLYERTAPTLETEQSTAVTAHLKIRGKLDYGDFGIEREDIPGVSYVFAITTKDSQENVINEEQLAYCIQSYFLTPLAGDHSAEMTDQVSAVNGARNLHKVIYYGYGGAGYDAEEFAAFLADADPSYYEQVYLQMSEQQKEELSYILTHGAASYAYFQDGTDFEEYLKLQFEVKYGDDWETQYGYFKGPELEKAGITDADMNLFGSTYGMTPEGIALVKGWYECLTEKADPSIRVEETEEGFVFEGNEKNEELELSFTVPDAFRCEISGNDGEIRVAQETETVQVYPGELFSLIYEGDWTSIEENGLQDLICTLDGTLSGTENEAWNLVLLETNKGTNRTVDKRQQDIASVSRSGAGMTELDFSLELKKGTLTADVKDEVQQAVCGAVFGVYYDEACSEAVHREDQPLCLESDEAGEIYLELAINEKLERSGNRLYLKQLSAPDGYAAAEQVFEALLGENIELTNVRVFEETKIPISCKVNLTGRPLKKGEFVFSLVPVDETGEESAAEEVLTAENDADGMVTFPDISVREPGNYRYEIVSEETSVPVVAEVTADPEQKGRLNVTISYPEGEAEFAKNYKAAGSIQLSGISVQLENDQLEEGEFRFELRDAAGTLLQTAENDSSGAVLFEALSYTQDDIGNVYEYTVSQVEEDENVVDYAAHTEIVAVTIEDSENSNGTLKIEQEGKDTVFVNHRVFVPVPVPVSCSIMLSGRPLKAGEFTCSLIPVVDADGTETMPGALAVTAQNQEDGTVSFEGVTVSEPGTYYYQVSLEQESFIVTAQVTADPQKKGSLLVETEYPQGEVQFEKQYTASGRMIPEGIQVVLDNDVLTEGEFLFELKDAAGTVLQRAENAADGTVTFEGISYTQDDIGKEYTYTVSQAEQEAEDTVCPDQICTVTVRVEDSPNSDGTLEITQKVTGAVFENHRVSEETETEAQTETETEAQAEKDAQTETETETDAQTETEQQTDSEEETESEASSVSQDKHMPVLLGSLLLLLLFWILKLLKRRKK